MVKIQATLHAARPSFRHEVQLSGNAVYIIPEVKGAHSALTRSSSRLHLLWPVCMCYGSCVARRVGGGSTACCGLVAWLAERRGSSAVRMRAERRNGAASGGTDATRRRVAAWWQWRGGIGLGWQQRRARGGVVCLQRRRGSAVWLGVAAQQCGRAARRDVSSGRRASGLGQGVLASGSRVCGSATMLGVWGGWCGALSPHWRPLRRVRSQQRAGRSRADSEAGGEAREWSSALVSADMRMLWPWLRPMIFSLGAAAG